LCDPGCVLLSRQCGLSTRKGFKWGGALCGLFCFQTNPATQVTQVPTSKSTHTRPRTQVPAPKSTPIRLNSNHSNSIQVNSIQLTSNRPASLQFDSIPFDSIPFESFNSIQFNAIRVHSIHFESIHFNSSPFDSLKLIGVLRARRPLEAAQQFSIRRVGTRSAA
jgi:hypothetical protein